MTFEERTGTNAEPYSENLETVVSRYTPEPRIEESYESEAELERDFIARLVEQGYEQVSIHSEKDLTQNLRKQLERLNGLQFSDAEWNRFFWDKLSRRSGENVATKTERIQKDSIQTLIRDDGSTEYVRLIDKKNIQNNFLQVTNQYVEPTGERKRRYDVTILVNGFPLVHVELKKRGVELRTAFYQIENYRESSFGEDTGLFEYVHVFVISNGTHTRYYSNTTRESALRERTRYGGQKRKSCSSYEFTSVWTDADNAPINDLVDFSKTFFAPYTLLTLLTRYCVLTMDKSLLVMRPYQIAAAERILHKIKKSLSFGLIGSTKSGGYIWHTTGSGKTLTSFKTAQLATGIPEIDKTFFVVDRKDLDYQTMREYERFSQGASSGSVSVKKLAEQIEDGAKTKIIVTTIQKLHIYSRRLVKRGETFPGMVVLIFDECHRSQFGEMRESIKNAFPRHCMFGFTGTPIFAQNASKSGKSGYKTTPQVFGGEPNKKGEEVLALHAYTIVDAIRDKNVLPFLVDYVNTVKMKPDVDDAKTEGADTKGATKASTRVCEIVKYILDHFNQKTSRNSYFKLGDQRVSGFNSLLAVESIPLALEYYGEFKRQLAESDRGLTIATIFSGGAQDDKKYQNGGKEQDPKQAEIRREYSRVPSALDANAKDEDADGSGGVADENSENTSGLDSPSLAGLTQAIADYNATFGTSYDAGEKFESYYKDVSRRVKNRELDLLIVVNMFLTGFDAPTLNTLWVDKRLKMHGLIQAFSRTNRILNSVKTYGNIVCFQTNEKATDEALALFGDKDAASVVLLRPYADYYCGYEDSEGKFTPGYRQIVERLRERYPIESPIVGEAAQKEFVELFGALLKVRNILTSFDEFKGNKTLSERDIQDYQSKYVDIWSEIKKPKKKVKGADIRDDLNFEIELAKRVEVNIDYILKLVKKYRESGCKDKALEASINRAVDSSFELRSKRDLVAKYVEKMKTAELGEVPDWREFVEEEQDADVEELAEQEGLDKEKVKFYIGESLKTGALKTRGKEFANLVPVNPFMGDPEKVRSRVVRGLKHVFNKFIGLLQ